MATVCFKQASYSIELPSLNCAGIFEQSMEARNRVGPMLSYRPASAGILEQSMGARNRVGIGLSYRSARLHRLAESIPLN
jgi:hypothetical protein